MLEMAMRHNPVGSKHANATAQSNFGILLL